MKNAKVRVIGPRTAPRKPDKQGSSAPCITQEPIRSTPPADTPPARTAEVNVSATPGGTAGKGTTSNTPRSY